ncbi:MAG TPA: ABC transporter permease [Terriglobales bacterium]|nr:ABC transporter permease [Terriglobales bacterium]
MPEWKPEILRRLAPLKLSSAREAEITEEVAQHLEDRYQELLAIGITDDEARRTAMEELKGEDLLARGLRPVETDLYLEPTVWGKGSSNLFAGILQDIRYALRMLRKSPGFTAVAVLTLALGIGANTAIFSLIDSILMRGLPVQDAQHLVVLRWSAHKAPDIHSQSGYGDCGRGHLSRNGESFGCSLSMPFFNEVASHVSAFSSVAAFANTGRIDLSGNGTASMLRGQAVSGGFFPLLGVRAAAGRLIAPSDDSVSAQPVVVLNYGYWKRQFGGSPSAIQKTVRLNNVPFTIIGVADPRFDSLSPGHVYDVWVPLSVLPQINPHPSVKARATDIYSWWLVIIGRLKPSVGRLQAQAAVTTVFRNAMLHGAEPLSKPEDDPKVDALPAQSGLSGSTKEFSGLLYVLMMAVGIVLLIACANVAGLLLSRATARQKEMAVRLVLGAGRRRIVQQLLTESVFLSLTGGALGILFAIWGTHAIVTLFTSSSDEPFGFSPGIDGRVLLFTFAAAVLTGIIFGLAPAFRGTRVDLTPALKEGTGSSAAEGRAGGRWFSLGNGLVIAQVALAVVVLVGAGLLVRTLQNLRNVDPGFDTRNLLTFGLDPTLIGYKTPQIDAFYKDLQQRIAAIPGVESVSYSNSTLLSGDLWETGFHLEGTPKDQESDADYLPIGAGFFSMMHMRLLAGRNFNSADFAEAEAAEERERAREAVEQTKEAGLPAPSRSAAVPESAANEAPVPVIVNKTFVQKYFPKVNPLGIHFGAHEADPAKGDWATPGWEILGVVSDAKYQDLRSPIDPTMYVPSSGGRTSFEVRTKMNPNAVTSAIRSVVSQMDSNLPVFDVHTQAELIDQLLFQERMIAKLSGFFGILALVLACIGLYGLLSYEVSRRTREVGVRMALGAQRRNVLRLVVGQGIVLAIAGALVGIGVALAMTRYLKSMLYDIHTNDPATIAGVAILLTLVAVAACYIPARRATRVDPMVALRYE